MPKPFKLDEAKKRRLLRQVIEGDSVERAARAVGCCRRTVERMARQDTLFQWRLKLARTARDQLCRTRQEEERVAMLANTPRPLGELLTDLQTELRRTWNSGSNTIERDLTVTQGAV